MGTRSCLQRSDSIPAMSTNRHAVAEAGWPRTLLDRFSSKTLTNAVIAGADFAGGLVLYIQTAWAVCNVSGHEF